MIRQGWDPIGQNPGDTATVHLTFLVTEGSRLVTMPKRDRNAYMREYRRRKRAEAVGKVYPAPPAPELPPWPQDPAGELARWSRNVLKVPAGHPRGGQPLELPDYGVSFIRDALTHRESFLCIARKCGKSAIVAVYLLARLVGPLRTAGYRPGVCSVNKDKAGELHRQAQEIAEASGLEGVTFTKVPRRITSATGTVDILSADKSAGHASGFDDAIFDELGLLAEKDRALVNGLRSSTSAKDGRFIALSIQGGRPSPRSCLTAQMTPAWRFTITEQRPIAPWTIPKRGTLLIPAWRWASSRWPTWPTKRVGRSSCHRIRVLSEPTT